MTAPRRDLSESTDDDILVWDSEQAVNLVNQAKGNAAGSNEIIGAGVVDL